MAKKHVCPKEENFERWLLPYADMITLLLAFFIIMYALTLLERDKQKKVLEEISKSFGGVAASSQGAPGLVSGGKTNPTPLKDNLGKFKKGTNKKVSYIEETGKIPTVGNIMNVVVAGGTGESVYLGTDAELIEKIKQISPDALGNKGNQGDKGERNLSGSDILIRLTKARKTRAGGADATKGEGAASKGDTGVEKGEGMAAKGDTGVAKGAGAVKGDAGNAKGEGAAAKGETGMAKGETGAGVAAEQGAGVAEAAAGTGEIGIGPGGENAQESEAAAGAGGQSAYNDPYLQKVTNKLVSIFSEEIAGGSLEVKATRRGIELMLQGDVAFELGSAILMPESMKLLEKINVILKHMHDLGFRFRVEGHTDNINVHSFLYPSNWELSCARAVSVVRYLTEELDLKPESISASGYGRFLPIADNNTVEGRKKNRRIEIIIYDPGKPTNITEGLINKGITVTTREQLKTVVESQSTSPVALNAANATAEIDVKNKKGN